MKNLTQSALELHKKRNPFVLAVIIEGNGSIPRKSGAKMLVKADGSIEGTIGGGMLEANVMEQAKEVFQEKKSRIYSFNLSSEDAAGSEMICGGNGTVRLSYFDGSKEKELIEQLNEVEQGMLYIFGGGHVSLQLVKVAELLEIPTVIMDDRKEFANTERFPHSECYVVPEFENIPNFTISEKDMIVVITRGHLCDKECLAWALETKAEYIGMIGSRRKKEMLFERLMEEGFSKERLEEVYAPIGLSIGAQTPGEIAVAIAAELIQFKARYNEK